MFRGGETEAIKKEASASFFLFQVFIQPVVESPLPENTILWFQDPVVLVGEIEEFRVEAAKDGGVVGLHALREADAVVQTAMNH